MKDDKYFLYHQSSVVKTIPEKDIPNPEHYPMEMYEGKERYCADLSTALSTKGITVENANVHGPDGLNGYLMNFFGHKMLTRENHLYPIPEGWEVKINHQWHPIGNSKWQDTNEFYIIQCQSNGVPTRTIAALIPIEKPEPVKQDHELKDDTIVKMYFRMEEAAEALQVDTTTIRFYDQQFGLNLHRDKNGKRKLSVDDLGRLALIFRLTKYFDIKTTKDIIRNKTADRLLDILEPRQDFEAIGVPMKIYATS